MSVNRCFVDLFPVEILHLIFDYLSSCDIVRAFLKLSSYIDSVIWNYHFYKVDFRSILKYDFDLICDSINPRRIISLILSDGIDTPGQSQIFLSLFKLQELNLNLRSLSLIDLNDQSMEIILNHLDKLNSLSSLTIINCSLSSPSMLMNIFPRLIRLNISSQCFFDNITVMNQLKHLIISNRCNFNQLGLINHHCPKLLSLNISLERENGGIINQIRSNLTRLIINMSPFQINLIQMKELLKCYPYLIEFEIECRSDIDLCDGYQWERFFIENNQNLKTFHFKFQLKSPLILNIIVIQTMLRSYSSSFWLNEKKWYMAIEWDQRLVYSVPRFSCESADPNFRPPIYSTAIDDSIYYDHINAFAGWGETNRRFTNVKELWLVDNPLKINFKAMIDVNHVERLIFASSKDEISIEILIDVISQMKNVHFIQFNSIPLSFEKYKGETLLKQIRSIEIIKELRLFSLIEILDKIFPQLERLHMKIKSNEDIEKMLTFFPKSLSMITFDCDTTNISIRNKSIEKILGHSNFTYQIDNNSIRFWIGWKKTSNDYELEERKNIGCFSWCSTRKFLFKRSS